MDIQTILVPTDFSKDADKALETAVELAKTFGARVEVVHVYHLEIPIASPMGGGYAFPDGFFESIRKHSQAKVDEVVRAKAGSGVDISGRAVEGPPSIAIAQEAEKISADLIVIGTRGLTGLKHVVLGSVAERTVRTAKCPVLTVKGDD